MKLYLLIVAMISFALDSTVAQKINKDTLYYSIDTLHVPLSDRMITIKSGNPHQFYVINCPCLSHNSKPVFRCNKTKQSKIDNHILKKIKFITIAQLIEVVRNNDNPTFNNKFALFFVEPIDKMLFINRVYLEEYSEPAIDYEIIK